MIRSRREAYAKVTAHGVVQNRIPWLPDTYDLDIPADCAAAIASEERCITDSGVGVLWIFKPAANNRGRGIRVFRGKESLEELCQVSPRERSNLYRTPLKGIVQRYIENPLLVNVASEQLKFDIRCYLLISTSVPGFLCYYHPGYCRLSLKPYSTDEESLTDPFVHLTNASVQKKDSSYQEKKELQVECVIKFASGCDVPCRFKASAP